MSAHYEARRALTEQARINRENARAIAGGLRELGRAFAITGNQTVANELDEYAEFIVSNAADITRAVDNEASSHLAQQRRLTGDLVVAALSNPQGAHGFPRGDTDGYSKERPE